MSETHCQATAGAGKSGIQKDFVVVDAHPYHLVPGMDVHERTDEDSLLCGLKVRKMVSYVKGILLVYCFTGGLKDSIILTGAFKALSIMPVRPRLMPESG